MAIKKRVTDTKAQELNQWCIEMALRWPTLTTYSSGGSAASAYYGGGSGPALTSQVDADVIGRANKIRDWVTATLPVGR